MEGSWDYGLIYCAISAIYIFNPGFTMKLTYNRTGGFANIPLSVSLDTAKLSPEQNTDLQTLLEKSFKLPLAPPSAELRDGHHYSLTVEDGDQSRSLETNDQELPDELDELFALIFKLSRK